MSTILNIIYALLILDVLVIAHEFGHLFAARSIGVPALSFSIGMGPVIARKKFKYFGDTEFRISLFPVGGYVMVSGEAEDSDDPNSLYRKSPWQRAWFSVSGALTNFVFAFIVFVVVALAFGDPVYLFNRIGTVDPNMPAAKAGIQSGDWILEIDGTQTPTWDAVVAEIRTRPDKEVPILVGRKSGKAEAEVSPDTSIWVTGSRETKLSEFKFPEEYPSDDIFIGIEGKYFRLNSIESVGNEEAGNWNKTKELLKAITSTSKITFGSSLETQTVKVTIAGVEEEQENGLVKVGKLGITASQGVKYKRYNIVEAIWISLEKFWLFLVAFFNFFVGLFSGKGVGDVAGPVGIIKITGQMASMGWAVILGFAAMLSMNLGFLNLIPFPGLDGARFLFSVVEGITGKKLPRAVENVIHAVGFIILIGLILLVTANDLFGIFRK